MKRTRHVNKINVKNIYTILKFSEYFRLTLSNFYLLTLKFL